MDQIRGLFINSIDYLAIPFKHYEDMGCTDIFCNGAYLGVSSGQYSSLIQQLQNVITACEGTNLNIWCDSAAFATTTQGVFALPTDSVHEALFASQLAQLFIDVPELVGVTFDDYNYQPSQDNPANQTAETSALMSFASTMATIVHNADKKLGAFIPGALNDLGANTLQYSEVFDFIAPEIYMNNIGNDGENTKEWLQSAILKHINTLSDSSILVPTLAVYQINESGTQWSLNTNKCQIQSTIECNTGGYILFNQEYMNDNILFLSESDFELNIGLSVNKGNVIPEKSSRKVTVTLTGQNGLPIPDAIIQSATGSYKVIDKASKAVITPSTPFDITGNIATIPLSSTQNSMIHNLNSEVHAIVVTVNYGTDQEENTELDVTIQNLSGI